MSLSPKHQLFVDKYFENNFNATKAYMEAYPDSSEKASESSSSEILRNPKVLEIINKRKEEQHQESLVTVKEVIDGIQEDITDAKTYGEKGLVARLKGRELLGRHIGAFKDITEYHVKTKSDEMIEKLDAIIGTTKDTDK